ncbi:MAG: LTA synthase family protein [Thermodesulfobacteriota bacterium]
MKPPSRRLRFFSVPLLIMLALCTLFRAFFYLLFAPSDAAVPTSTLAHAFYLGLKFDLRLILLLLLPGVLLGLVRPLDPTRSARARNFWLQHYTLLALVLCCLYLFDLANYAYLNEHIDASALRYLQNPLISLQMVWETYPVVWGAVGLMLGGILCYLIMHVLTPRPDIAARFAATPQRGKRVLTTVFVIICYGAGIYGNYSFYPLRWSDAYFSADTFIADLTLNPLLFFANSLSTAEAEQPFDSLALSHYHDRLTTYLGIDDPDPEKLLLARYVHPLPKELSRPNIVVILLESFASHLTGSFGNPLAPSPHFDAIAGQGMLFRHFYTPRNGTARGVFTTLTGIPDTITYRTASRNPLTITHNTILRSFNGYRKLYFLGGSANWANIRALFMRNHEDFEIYEEGDFRSSRVDVWGITDYDLFTEANSRLTAIKEAPFFAFIHLSGHHRPYTIPEGIPGFALREEDSGLLVQHGFESAADFNSFRLLDHSLGHFFTLARQEPYFARTVFIILSDNGTDDPSRVKPACEEALRLGFHHAPLVIYAPGLIPAGHVIDTPATQMDVMPTAAALAGIPALNTTLGRNLLDPRFAGNGKGFVYRTQGMTGELVLYDGSQATMINTDGSNLRSRSCPEPERPAAPTELDPDAAELALALYHASKYLLYNNQPERYAEHGFAPIAPLEEASPVVPLFLRNSATAEVKNDGLAKTRKP